ncbi:2OG-Fe(II) oxygenase [Variovorax sp. RCC_210]|uniref:2OG-Fe(II) oxygenase n=1 Tax=Variovorax sp. RCC_210 TaxID=3239217 RepID=UPI003523611E
MSEPADAVLRFAPALSEWVLHNLRQGCAPAQVMEAMRAQRMPAEAARSIVDAFVFALRTGSPVPVDSVTVAPPYQYEPSRLPQGTSIRAADRLVRVAARAAQPAMAVLNDVLDAQECEELIALARPRLTPSTTVDPLTGQDRAGGHRSSLGMFFRLRENPLVARIDERVSALMNLPVENGEGLQVLHYPAGAQSLPHFDFLVPSNAANQASLERSGQRVSTLVSYLNDVEEGGETVFPETGWSVSPQRGSAVYFEYCNSLGQIDPASLHAGAAVVRGEKWVVTKWMRQRRFVPAPAPLGR